MPPKGKDKKDKKTPPKVDLAAMGSGQPVKPKKIPPPPACFTPEDIAKYKEMFKLHDEDNTERIPLNLIGLMLRKLGFNPKQYEIKEFFKQFLEDEFVDCVELHEWYFIVEAKLKLGDDFERDIVKACQNLIHDDEETGFGNIELLKEELMTWGEPLTEEEWVDFPKLALREKALVIDENLNGTLNYKKFIEICNEKDATNRACPEPINFFKLDQKTLAAMAIAKFEKEKAEKEKEEAERKAREEARRQRMIAQGLIIEDN